MRIAILGYGAEGKALADYFKGQKVDITICDENEQITISETFSRRVGKEAFKDLKDFDVVFKSPGVPNEKIDKNANITSLTQYFYEQCPCPIIAVTGTKGKGTTSTLLYEMLKEAGEDVYLGGNIGTPPLEFLNKLTKDSVVVLETSSFQAESLKQSPQTAVILMVTEDHLDHHGTLEAYHRAKANLVQFQNEEDVVIVNKDYPASIKIADISKAQKKIVSTQKEVTTGACIENGKVVLKKNGEATVIMDTEEIGMVGAHNIENVLAAMTAADHYGVTTQAMKKVATSFKGLPHRLEWVKEEEGVQYFNDSFAVNPSSSIAAIKAFAKPVILLAGGFDRGLDFTEWAKICVQGAHVKQIILLGDNAAPRMHEALKNQKETRDSLVIVRVANLSEGIIQAKKAAEHGDVVVLSPGCASFDEFKNYKERGEAFKQLV